MDRRWRTAFLFVMPGDQSGVDRLPKNKQLPTAGINYTACGQG
jgi:hypothetical protein